MYELRSIGILQVESEASQRLLGDEMPDNYSSITNGRQER